MRRKVIKSTDVGTIGEALLDAELQKSDHVQTTEEMRKAKNDGLAARKKCKMPPGSCVKLKDRRRGKVKRASELDLEIANLLHRAKQEKLKDLILNSPTNIVMAVVHSWSDIAGQFSRRNIIPGEEFFDKKGNVRLKVSWVITGMLECHKEFMERQYGKLVDEISVSKLRNNVSSLMSRVFRSLVLVGLAHKDDTIKTKGAPASCYVLSKEIGKMTLEQFHYVFQGGIRLFKRVADGEFEKPKAKKAPKKAAPAKTNVSDDGKSATINVADGLAIKAININATPQGGVSIEIKFK